jgi:hypothetical protein
MSRRPTPLVVLAAAVAAVAFVNPVAHAQQERVIPKGPGTSFIPRETDPNSPRHTRLKAMQEDPSEIVRIDADGDGDPDILEHWFRGNRVRWFDENDDMKPTDVRGDQVMDAMQVDRDGDGYYDGPGDISIKWADDNGDGRADVQIFAANPAPDAKGVRSGLSHFMVFIDTDQDGVNGFIDWTNWEYHRANWRVQPTTSPARPQVPPNFLADYMGNTIFLKQHYPAWSMTDIRLNWENPFAFYDFDDDGLAETTIRFLDTTEDVKGAPETGATMTYRGMVNEAMGGWDLDNDSSAGNEFDFDMSIRFGSAADGSKGARIDYREYSDKHPKMKAPQWVLDGKYFRYDNWRVIEDFCYVTHDKCFEEMWGEKGWGETWLAFDEDDDDQRWERVEFYYPTPEGRYHSTKRWKGYTRTESGLAGHPQADSLGDRSEWDADNSGKGQVYVGAWDGKVHLHGAEKGAWSVDYRREYWGAGPVVVGISSPKNAEKVEEIVAYEDVDGNGFFDLIKYDYDGDEKYDLEINLLEYKTAENPRPDVRPLTDPGTVRWEGMHELFKKVAWDGFQQGLAEYNALWKKGLTTVEMDRELAFASSVQDRYNNGYWLKEKIFRELDKHLAGKNELQAQLRRAHFTGDHKGVIAVIDGLDPAAKK